MLKIKLARFGKRNQPHYRIVVNEARSKRDGEYKALIGHYAPTQTPKLLEVNMQEYAKWIKQGAQPTDTVASLVKRFESGNPFPKKTKVLSKKAKAKLENEKNAKAEAKAQKSSTDKKPEPTVDKVETVEKADSTNQDADKKEDSKEKAE